jgi:hypothetical protein
MAAVAKSYMKKGFLIYEEMHKYPIYCMRRALIVYDFETAPFWISLYRYMRTFFFISVGYLASVSASKSAKSLKKNFLMDTV